VGYHVLQDKVTCGRAGPAAARLMTC